MPINDSMSVPLKGEFSLDIAKSGKIFIAEFTDWMRRKVITAKGSTAQLSRARLVEAILLYYYHEDAPLRDRSSHNVFAKAIIIHWSYAND